MADNTELAPVYRYFTADLLTNEILSEIPFQGVSYERAIKGAGGFSGNIPVIEGTKNLGLYETTLPGKTALYVVRNGVCVWGGIIWARSYNVVDRVLNVTASEFTSYFYHRRIWKTWNHQYGCTVEANAGVAKVTLDYGSATSALNAQASVKLEFGENNQRRYDNFYTIAGAPAPTNDVFYIDPVQNVVTATRAQIVDGLATIYTDGSHNFQIGDLVTLDFGVGSVYNGTHSITDVSGPSLDRFSYLEADAVRALADVTGTVTRTLPDGTYTGVTVSVRTDTYDYIRSLVTSVFDDFVGTDFPNVYIEPGISYGFDIVQRALQGGLATVTTDDTHNLSIGQAVQITDMDTLWDGEYVVTETPADNIFRFALGGTLASETVTVNGHEVSNIGAINGEVTVTTTTPHNFLVGQNVEIDTGIESGGLGPYLNGTFNVASITSPTTFKYSTPSSANVPSTSLIPALATSASDINLYPNPSFEGVTADPLTMIPLRTNLVKWGTIFGNSSYFGYSNAVGGGTASLDYTSNSSYPTGWALRYIVSTAPTDLGAYVGTQPNNASGFSAQPAYTYTASVYVYSQYATTAYLTIPWVNASNVTVSSSTGDSVSIPANTLTRVSVTGVAPATAVTGGVRLFHDSRLASAGQWFEFTSHMVEQTDQVREYFDGSLPNRYGYDYNWVGPALRSTSIALGSPIAVRTNLSVNPGAEVAPGILTTGYNEYDTVAQSTVQKYAGTYSFLCTHGGIYGTNVIGLQQPVPVVSGVTYAVSARVLLPQDNIGTPNGTGRIKIGTDLFDFSYTAVEDSWIRVSGTITATSTGVFSASIGLNATTVWSAGDIIYVDSILIESSTTIGAYFDGDTQSLGDFLYGWSGIPGGSISFQYTPKPFAVETVNCIASQSVDWASSGSKSVRLVPNNSLSNDTRIFWDFPAFTIGQTYTVKGKIRLSAPLRGSLAANARRIRIVKNGSVQIARSDPAPNIESVREVSVTFTVPSDATSLRVDFFNGASKGNGDIWWDDVVIVEGGDAGFDVEYFDGDFLPNNYFTYAWSGAPHLSTSERRITTGISEADLTSNTVTLKTAIPHGYDVGRQVTISGVTPEVEIVEKAFDAISSVATITTAIAHEFQVGENLIISGLRDASDLSKRVVSGSNVAFTTRLAHNFTAGDVVTIGDLFDVSNLTHKQVTSNIATFTTKVPHNMSTGDEVTISDLYDFYTVTSKRIDNDVAKLTLSTTHNLAVNDQISVAGIVDTAQVISKTVENGLAVLTTRYAHNFLEEEEVVITGLGAPYDGTFKISSFTDAQILYAVDVAADELIPLTAADGLITGTNSVFNGDYVISAVTSNTISYNRVANSVIPDGEQEGVVLTLSPLNGTYPVLDAPSSTTFRYETALNNVAYEAIPEPVVADKPEDQQPPATASTPSIHLGERTLKSVTRNTISFVQTGIPNSVALEDVSGVATVDSIFNGPIEVDSVTENTFTYSLSSPSNVLETSANNLAYVRAPQVFNGVYTITAVDQEANTFSYTKVHTDRVKAPILGYGSATVRPTAVVSSFGPYPGNANIGIGFSTKAYSGTNIDPIVYRGFELKNVGEALNAYSDSLNGFEYRIDCSYDEAAMQFTKTFVLIPIDFPNPPAAGELSPLSRFGADKFVFDYPGSIINVSIEESAENSSTRFFAVGESDLGPDAGPPMGIASNTELLDGSATERRWPLLDDDEQVKGVAEETTLYSYAQKYLTEARPPDAKMSVSVNGSLQPVVGSYAPGDWCALIVKDEFLLERMASGLEPRTDVIVRKIDSLKVSVPDGTTFPERVDLVLVPEWEVDKRGQ